MAETTKATKETVDVSESKIPAASRRVSDTSRSTPRGLKVISLGFLCFALSFLGAWAGLKSGIVASGETSITEKRSIVSDEGEVVSDVARTVSASVVSVTTESQAPYGLGAYTQEGAGTGVIISEDGYILTNRHVVSGATKVNVTLADGTTYENVDVVGSDTVNDLAFLKLKDTKGLRPAAIGDSSKVEVGQKVIAIGNALGQYQTSVTSGIISGLGRPLVAGDESGTSSEQLSNLLQTDAAINPGNSGGPLLNLSGEVVGINTAVDQQAQGIGFAIPINDAKGLITSVTTTGKLKRAFLGVSHVTVTADVKKQYSLPVEYGAYVVNGQGSAVTAGSPAEKAGIKPGDIITKIDGQKLDSQHPLLSMISQHQAGDTVLVAYMRNGKEASVSVVLAEYPATVGR